MKISYMLKREDFYQINERTLKKYYQNSKEKKRLYIYPELNAIVTVRPSKAVRQYLYTEYRVNGSLVKRLLVRLYVTVLLNSCGIFASKSLQIPADANRDTLIYPCNKKYRIFDFKNKRVSVLGKDGFPKDDLMREIAFRTGHTADFIPGFLYVDDSGYTEMIIDGSPVARTGDRMNSLCDRAFAIWKEYIQPHTHHVPSDEYAETLAQQVKLLTERLKALGKWVDVCQLNHLCDAYIGILRSAQAEVPVSLSHGDLQPGNIWVENTTDKVFIIDWESWKNRSIWYDQSVLYEGLRRKDGIARYAKSSDLTHATVLLEDIIFRLTELTTLPENYGCTEFDAYIKNLLGGNTSV